MTWQPKAPLRYPTIAHVDPLFLWRGMVLVRVNNSPHGGQLRYAAYPLASDKAQRFLARTESIVDAQSERDAIRRWKYDLWKVRQ